MLVRLEAYKCILEMDDDNMHHTVSDED